MIPAAEHRDSELQTRDMWVKVAAGGAEQHHQGRPLSWRLVTWKRIKTDEGGKSEGKAKVPSTCALPKEDRKETSGPVEVCENCFLYWALRTLSTLITLNQKPSLFVDLTHAGESPVEPFIPTRSLMGSRHYTGLCTFKLTVTPNGPSLQRGQGYSHFCSFQRVFSHCQPVTRSPIKVFLYFSHYNRVWSALMFHLNTSLMLMI